MTMFYYIGQFIVVLLFTAALAVLLYISIMNDRRN